MRLHTENFDLSIHTSGKATASKLAIVLPGFLDSKDYPHARSHVKYLGEHGYLSVSFDPPGTWESSENIQHYTFTNYLRAVDDVITYFENKPTLLVGHSMGGTIAMLSAARNPHVDAFVAIMSSYAYVREDNYQERVVKWKETGTKISYRDLPNDPAQKRQLTLSYSFVEDASKYNALNDLPTLTKPKLFIRGEDDDVVPEAVIEQAYKVSAEPKDLATLKSDHDYRWHPQHIDEVNGLIGNFVSNLE